MTVAPLDLQAACWTLGQAVGAGTLAYVALLFGRLAAEREGASRDRSGALAGLLGVLSVSTLGAALAPWALPAGGLALALVSLMVPAAALHLAYVMHR